MRPALDLGKGDCMKRYVAGVVLLLGMVSAFAEVGNVAIGVGAGKTCTDWSRERAKPREQDGGGSISEFFMLSWVQGHFSGMNRAGELGADRPVITLPNQIQLSAWLDKYCVGKSNHTLESASTSLMDDLWAKYPRRF